MLLKKLTTLSMSAIIAFNIISSFSYADVDESAPDYLYNNEMSGSSGDYFGSYNGSYSGSYSSNQNKYTITDYTEKKYSYGMDSDMPKKNYVIPISEFKKNPDNFKGENVISDDNLRHVLNILYEREGTDEELKKLPVTKQMVENLIFLSPEQCKAHNFEEVDFKVKSLEGLQYAKNLEWLSLVYQKVSDLSPIKDCTKIRHLDLRDNKGIDINEISNLTNIEYLDIHETGVNDLSPLKNMKKMKMLVAYANNIEDISPLSEMKEMVFLSLEYNNFGDISALSGMKNLEHLNLGKTEGYSWNKYNKIKDISYLRGMTKMKDLNISSNAVSDISPISDMKNLENLDLNSNQITDISSLSKLYNLKKLYLSDNQISSIEALKELSLRRLDIDGNDNVNSLEPLKNMISLDYLKTKNIYSDIEAYLSPVKDLYIGNIMLGYSQYKDKGDGKTYEYLGMDNIPEISVKDRDEINSLLPKEVKVNLNEVSEERIEVNDGEKDNKDITSPVKEKKYSAEALERVGLTPYKAGIVLVDEDGEIIKGNVNMEYSTDDGDFVPLPVKTGEISLDVQYSGKKFVFRCADGAGYSMSSPLVVEASINTSKPLKKVINDGVETDYTEVDLSGYDYNFSDDIKHKKPLIITLYKGSAPSPSTKYETKTVKTPVTKAMRIKSWSLESTKEMKDKSILTYKGIIAHPSNMGFFDKQYAIARVVIPSKKNEEKFVYISSSKSSDVQIGNSTEESKPYAEIMYEKAPAEQKLMQGELSNAEKVEDVLLKDSTGDIKGLEDLDDKNVEIIKIKDKKISRVAGEDRIHTSIEVSKKYFKKSENVIIVDSKNQVDSLLASSLSKEYSSPILMVNGSDTAKINEEIARLGARKAIIVGGENSVKPSVESDLSKRMYVERISGKNRYETSIAISNMILEKNSEKKIVIASAKNMPDSMSSGVISSHDGSPILLVDTSSEGKKVIDYANSSKVDNVVIVGGQGSVGKSIEKSLSKKSPVRLEGRDRYETSVIVANSVYKNPKKVFMVSGNNLSDGLSISPVSAKENIPFILVKKDAPTSLEMKYSKSAKELVLIGGGDSISYKKYGK